MNAIRLAAEVVTNSIDKMAKKQSATYTCTSCQYQSLKWIGCCPECSEWNTFSLEKEIIPTHSLQPQIGRSLQMHTLTTVAQKPTERLKTGIQEWDRVTGGGIVPGAFIMLTGDPGIGKSTLLLQIGNSIATQGSVYYFSSEESLEQVKSRADRINAAHNNMLFSDQAHLDDIIATCMRNKPQLVIIDSLQNCATASPDHLPGSSNSVKEIAFKLMRLAKEHGIAIILSGHITKDGMMAGPKMVEHMVDAVFYLQGEDRWQTRILRSVKNRFGAVHEIGLFEMSENGLQELSTLHQEFLMEATKHPGSALISTLEGTRPLIIEVQALTVPTKFGNPQRVITGFDHNHVIIIAAILEKYLGIKLSGHDIFFKISGGLKVKGHGADLGIALALLSSYFQQPLPHQSLALGEISLTGQIKPINHASIHLSEASKLGIQQILLSNNQKLDTACKTIRFNHLYELLTLFKDIQA